MKRSLSILGKLFLLLFVLGLDAGLLPGLGGNWNLLNISLIFSIFFVFIFRNSTAYTFYFSSLVLIALSAGNLFFIPLIAGFVSLFLINLLLERFFTNRSYYVLVALGIIAWLSYHSIYAILVSLYHYLSPEALLQPISIQWFYQILVFTPLVIVLLSLGYIAINFMSKRFKSYFIISDY